jgi:hypothetical protein
MRLLYDGSCLWRLDTHDRSHRQDELCDKRLGCPAEIVFVRGARFNTHTGMFFITGMTSCHDVVAPLAPQSPQVDVRYSQ